MFVFITILVAIFAQVQCGLPEVPGYPLRKIPPLGWPRDEFDGKIDTINKLVDDYKAAYDGFENDFVNRYNQVVNVMGEIDQKQGVDLTTEFEEVRKILDKNNNEFWDIFYKARDLFDAVRLEARGSSFDKFVEVVNKAVDEDFVGQLQLSFESSLETLNGRQKNFHHKYGY
ncbi:hypothetical protein Bhyg_17161 [Pseudolycoriella hygida]|uniref:Uncharacterized protein n=1 Tax=Pseudolycoriella hygida TaxID=35572 RepID=A0A9Q0RUY7_9DIPT|nr:hypothetical protein Bhyg_17161 [Pseudolycoriella hygida]